MMVTCLQKSVSFFYPDFLAEKKNRPTYLYLQNSAKYDVSPRKKKKTECLWRCVVPTKRLAFPLAVRVKPNKNTGNIMISKNTSSIWKDSYSVLEVSDPENM